MIYIVSHYYPPVQNPPARRMDALVNWLARKYGADNITVITGRPNHPEGKLAQGFRWRLYKRHAGRHNERVIHLYELAAPNRGFWRKTLGYLSFAAAVFLYFLFRRLKRADLVLVTVPPIFTGYAVHAVSLIRRRLRYIVDVRDIWPQVVAGMGFLREGGLLYRFCMHWSNALYRRACLRVCNVPGIFQHFKDINIYAKNYVIPNTINTDQFASLEKHVLQSFRDSHSDWFPVGHLIILYAGTQSVYMGLDVLLKAVNRIKDSCKRLRILMIGYGEEQASMQEYIKKHDLSHIFRIIPHMDSGTLVKAINCADYCFSSTSKEPIMNMVIPTKVLEYLACGKTIIGSHNAPFIDQLAGQGLALNVPAGEDGALAQLILEAMKNPKPKTSIKAVEFIKNNYATGVFTEKWQTVFNSVFFAQ
jgi:glycosyltransferase involved in cell wall biosynthesis